MFSLRNLHHRTTNIISYQQNRLLFSSLHQFPKRHYYKHRAGGRFYLSNKQNQNHKNNKLITITSPFTKLPQKWTEYTIQTIRQYDRQYSYQGLPIIRYTTILILILLPSSTLLFRDEILSFLSNHTSIVAGRTLRDERIRKEVDDITKRTTDGLLRDPKTVRATVNFLLRLLQEEETREQSVAFLNGVLTDEKTVRALSDVLNDPLMIRHVAVMLGGLLNDEKVRMSLMKMIHSILEDDVTVRILEDLIKDVMSKEHVREATAVFVSNVLRRPEVLKAASESGVVLIEGLAEDDKVRGDVARFGKGAVVKMVLPSFLWGGGDGDKG